MHHARPRRKVTRLKDRPHSLIIDRLANALRGGRWQDPIQYRTPPEWQRTFENTGFHLIESRDLGGWLHAKQLFVIEPGRLR